MGRQQTDRQTDRQRHRRTSRILDRIGPVGRFGENIMTHSDILYKSHLPETLGTVGVRGQPGLGTQDVHRGALLFRCLSYSKTLAEHAGHRLHYGVGHGSVPCRTFFAFFVYSTIVPRLLATSPREQVLRVVTGTQELLRRQIMAVTSYYIIL